MTRYPYDLLSFFFFFFFGGLNADALVFLLGNWGFASSGGGLGEGGCGF